MCLQPVTKLQSYLQAVKAIIFCSNEVLQNRWIRDIPQSVFASSFTAVFWYYYKNDGVKVSLKDKPVLKSNHAKISSHSGK